MSVLDGHRTTPALVRSEVPVNRSEKAKPLARMRKILAEWEENVELITRDAGLAVGSVDLTGEVKNQWFNVLKEADRQNVVGSVIRAIRDSLGNPTDVPWYSDLVSAYQSYLHAVNQEDKYGIVRPKLEKKEVRAQNHERQTTVTNIPKAESGRRQLNDEIEAPASKSNTQSLEDESQPPSFPRIIPPEVREEIKKLHSYAEPMFLSDEILVGTYPIEPIDKVYEQIHETIKQIRQADKYTYEKLLTDVRAFRTTFGNVNWRVTQCVKKLRCGSFDPDDRNGIEGNAEMIEEDLIAFSKALTDLYRKSAAWKLRMPYDSQLSLQNIEEAVAGWKEIEHHLTMLVDQLADVRFRLYSGVKISVSELWSILRVSNNPSYVEQMIHR